MDIRLKRLKIGAVGLRNTRRIQLLLSSRHPYQRRFGQVAQALGSGCSAVRTAPAR